MDNTVPSAARPSRPLIAILGALLTATGAILMAGVIATARQPVESVAPEMALFASGVLLVVSLSVFLLGLYLVHIGAPGLPGRLRARVAAAVSPDTWRTLPRRLWPSPWGRALMGLVVVVVGAVVSPRGARWVASFVVLGLYSVGDPILLAVGTRWWVKAVQSLVGWLMLFLAAAAISDADKLGEGGMIFLLPMMVYPVALGLSGLVQAVRWLLR